MPIIRKFLDLSTCHLDIESRDWLERCANEDYPSEYLHREIWPVVAHPTGYFAYALEPAFAAIFTVPKALQMIHNHARKYGCDYILFDMEGPEDPDLTLFNVEN